MALKAVIFLATVGLVYSQSHCSAFDSDSNFGRDCTCGDKAFDSCEEPNTNDKFHVNTIDECKFQCDLFNSFGACDWFLFYQGGGMDENCHLFGPGKEGLSDFLNTCTVRGGALRNADDKCLEEVDYCDNTGICPGGSATSTAIPTIEQCFNAMSALGVSAQVEADEVNFYTYDLQSELCKGWPSGERSCTAAVADVTLSLETIKQCRNE